LRLGVLSGSVLSGLLGYALVRHACRTNLPPADHGR
jgi:hypothetical protein